MKFNFVIGVIVVLGLFACARPVSIKGGEKDTQPPKLLKYSPANKSKNIHDKKYTIDFDEYIKLDNPNKRVVFSPPLKYNPSIKPSASPRKVLSIELDEREELLPETTYFIQFNHTIEDNNEGNKIPFLSYVFSTGEVLDSLSFRLEYKDPFKTEKKEEETSIYGALYQNDTLDTNDLYKYRPKYLSLSDSGKIKLDFLKEGKYELLVFEDSNQNLIYDPGAEKVGFIDNSITLPTDSVLTKPITLFKESPKFNITDYTWDKIGMATFKYDSIWPSDIKLKLKYPEIKDAFWDYLNFENKVQFLYKDSIKSDSLVFYLTKNEVVIDTLKMRKSQLDSIGFDMKQTNSRLVPKDTIWFQSQYPLKRVELDSIKVEDLSDSLHVIDPKVIWKENTHKLGIYFPFGYDANFKLELKDSAVYDYFDRGNQAIGVNVQTKSESKYGGVTFSFDNFPNFPLVIEVLKEKGEEVIMKKIVNSNKLTEFKDLDAGKYQFRAIIDKNNNGKYDTGSFIYKRQPEEILKFPKIIEIREYWHTDENWNLQTED